jgi:polyphosphate glucokinase
MNILVVDVGGSSIKILATGQDKPRKFSSGPKMTAEVMVTGVKELARDWKYDVISIGYPGQVREDCIVSEPHNLAPGWVGFDFPSAFGRPRQAPQRCGHASLGKLSGRQATLFSGWGQASVRRWRSMTPFCRWN